MNCATWRGVSICSSKYSQWMSIAASTLVAEQKPDEAYY